MENFKKQSVLHYVKLIHEYINLLLCWCNSNEVKLKQYRSGSVFFSSLMKAARLF